MNSTELLPCPFCGGHARPMTCEIGVRGTMGHNKWVTITCSMCEINNGGKGGFMRPRYDTEQDAAKAWNTRADKAAPVGDVDLDNAREVFEKWITANGDYPHLKHKSFGGNYLHEEVAMKWDGFRAGYYTQPKQSAPVERIDGKIEKLLLEFSIQKLSSEMEEDALERADFQFSHDTFIRKTRAYLKLQGGE